MTRPGKWISGIRFNNLAEDESSMIAAAAAAAAAALLTKISEILVP